MGYETAAAAGILLLLAAGCVSSEQRGDEGILDAIRIIREADRDFGSAAPGVDDAARALREYDVHYRFPADGVRTETGYLDASSGRYRIFTRLFVPDRPSRGTVLIVHGYLTHSGCLSDLTRFLLDRDYAVLLFDLPGHGLSSGAPGEVPSFAVYGDAVAAVVEELGDRLPGPIHAVGHSTGCAALLDYLLRPDRDPFRTVVLLAPLVRSRGWGVSRLGESLLSPFTRSVPRVFRTSSSDPSYLLFLRNEDPLQLRTVPLSWFTALDRWNRNLPDGPALRRPGSTVAVQGTRDGVVAFEYNLPRLEEIVPDLEIRMIEDARHDLANEGEPLRAEVYRIILESLEPAGLR